MNRDEVGEGDAVAAREPERLQRDVVRAQELAQLPVFTHGAAAREEACALRRRAATALVAADENGSHREAADRVLEGRAGAGRPGQMASADVR